MDADAPTRRCDVRVWGATIAIAAVVAAAAYVAILFHEPSYFSFILLGFGSLVALARFALLSRGLCLECWRAAPLRRSGGRRVVREMSIDELAELIERGDVVIGGFQTAPRILRADWRATGRARAAASARDIARLPSYRFAERAGDSISASAGHLSAATPAADPEVQPDASLERAALLSPDDPLGATPGPDSSTELPPAQTRPKPAGADSETAAPSQSCAICLEQYATGDLVSLMPCLHGFHEQCLTQWLGIKAQCPVCKASLQTLLRNSANWGGT